jgi:hypothetical protein
MRPSGKQRVSSIDAFVFDGAFVALTLAVLPPSHVHGIRIRTDSRTEAETVTVMINDPPTPLDDDSFPTALFFLAFLFVPRSS